jgi:hypothetical protein
MPNWCYNYVTFFCPNKEIYDKLITAMLEDLWFETFAPLGLDPEKYKDGWDYKTAIEMWGTKWDPADFEILNKNDEVFMIDVSFDTAWSPPNGVYSKMYENFGIEIVGYYYELGCEFFGWCKYSKNVVFDENFTIPSNKKELEQIKKDISSSLNDFMEPTWDSLEEQWIEEGEEELEN